jgi:hypothetical protein
MHSGDKSPTLAELTEAQREQAMSRFRVLRSHRREVSRFQERRRLQAWVYGLSSDGLLNTVQMAWLDLLDRPAKIVGDESFRQKQWN